MKCCFCAESFYSCWSELEELQQFIQQEGDPVLFRCVENNVNIIKKWIYCNL